MTSKRSLPALGAVLALAASAILPTHVAANGSDAAGLQLLISTVPAFDDGETARRGRSRDDGPNHT